LRGEAICAALSVGVARFDASRGAAFAASRRAAASPPRPIRNCATRLASRALSSASVRLAEVASSDIAAFFCVA